MKKNKKKSWASPLIYRGTFIYSFAFILFVFIGSLSAQTQVWVSRYNGPANNIDNAKSIAVDGSGNVYVTGNSNGTGTSSDYRTVKYNSSGVQQWVATFNGAGNDWDGAYAIAVDGSGNVYVTGSSTGTGANYDITTIKYNSAGVQQWIAFYDGAGNNNDGAYSIKVDGSGNVYVAGFCTGAALDYNYCTIKYNSAGVQQWVATYNGTANSVDQATSMAIDALGNVYVTGFSMQTGTIFDYVTIKYNSAGVQQWIGIYNGSGNSGDQGRAIAVDGSGNVYVTGNSFGTGTSLDYATIKYNSSGVQQWVALYDGPASNSDAAYDIKLDGSGNIYVTGESVGTGTNMDYATVKYNSAGVQQWEARYNGPGNGIDGGRALVIDGLGNVYVTGESEGSGTDYDYCTIKYSQLTGIREISSEIPSEFSLSQNYPNPFNPTTNIRFTLPQNTFAKLIIYDALGREVESLVNGQFNAGKYEVNWNATKYPSGIYYYRLEAGNYIVTKKMILTK